MTTRPPVPAIDVHTHLFPARLSRAIRNALHEMYGWTFALSDDPETFAAFLREHGTERFCMLPYAHKPMMARSLNAWMVETAALLPGAIAFACVHPDDDDPASIVADALDAGCVGLKLHHNVQRVAPDDERLHPVYELMLERDAPLIVHAGRGPTDSAFQGVEAFAALMERYPGLRIAVAHMGIPEREAFLALVPRYPNLYLDTSALRGRALDGIDDIPIERILYGSDAPNIGHNYSEEIEGLIARGLGDDANRLIFRENALRFLRMN